VLRWGGGAATLPGPVRGVGARPVLLVLALTAPLAWVAVVARRRPFDAVIAVLPWAIASTVGADVWLFAHRWSAVEPARVFDAAIFSLLWAAALGLGYLGARLLPPLTRGPARPAAALLAVVLLAVLPDP